MDYAKESLKMHYDLKGKLEIKCRAAVDSKEALSLAYTPGVRTIDTVNMFLKDLYGIE